MPEFDYDYLVIGAGSGGVRSARIAAGHGAKVAIIEKRFLGGTCVNVGCVPKKLFSYAADFGAEFDDAKRYGWSADNISFDWNTLRENKDAEIKRLNGIYENLLKNAGADILYGTAKFIDKHTVDVDGKKYSAEKILIATGGRPRYPEFPGCEHAIVSDDAFYLDKLPKHVLIQGGGYISVEFAHILHGLGVKVTLIYRGDGFLRGFDHDISDFLAEEMRKQGQTVIFQCDIERIDKDSDGYKVACTNDCTIECDLVFSAIGRVPETGALDLDAAGIKHDPNGRIPVNEHYQTDIPHIFAVGDVCNKHNLTPVALAEGHVLADRLFGGNPAREVNYKNIATAIFSGPPIGTIGVTEHEARDHGIEVDVYKSSFKPLKHTLSGRDERTLMKLIVEKKTEKVLGLHMCGLDAPEILQGFAVAINMGATKKDFDHTIGIHPTAAEELVTMRQKS